MARWMVEILGEKAGPMIGRANPFCLTFLFAGFLSCFLPHLMARCALAEPTRQELERAYAAITWAITTQDVAALVAANYGWMGADGLPAPPREIEAGWRANFAGGVTYGPVSFRIDKLERDGDQ